MMALFGVGERKSVLDEIVAFAERNEHVLALVAVGSGAFDYVDELSDLDVLVVIDRNENMESVMDDVAVQMNRQQDFVYFKQMLQRGLQVYVSDNYLEVDIGYVAQSGVSATRKHWRVLFDKTGRIDEAMRDSWAQRETAEGREAHDQKLFECSDVVWHNLMHAAVAIKRGQAWRAIAELDRARDLFVGLLGCRYSLEVKRGREVDRLPEAELAALEKTMVSGPGRERLWQALEALTDAVYTELERHGERACITVTRRQVNEYIEACKALG